MQLGSSLKTKYKSILLMTACYATAIVFPAYGPIFSLYADQASVLMLSTLFLLVFSAGIFFIPMLNINLGSSLWRFISAATILAVIFFPFFGLPARSIGIMLLGIFTARVILLWSIDYISLQVDMSYGKFFTSILLLSYSTLYIFNVFAQKIHTAVAIFFPAIGLFILMAAFDSVDFSLPKASKKSAFPPAKYLFPIFIIYISAGITYAGIYPLISRFEFYERFYNVLPFLVALPFVNLVHKRRGLKALLWVGISLLGFSFLFQVFELCLWNYLVIQTLLQAGWAFMNSFVWIFASDLSRINHKPFYFSSILAAFLLGTSIGSAIYILIGNIFSTPHIAFIGLIPLLGVLVFTQMIPNDLKRDIETFESSQIDSLTQREKEIFLLLLENMKNKDIAEKLRISPNTLKKHCGSIYKKLDMENKTELIKVYGNLKKA